MNAERIRSAPPTERFTSQVASRESSAESPAGNPLPDGTKKQLGVDDHVAASKKPDRTELLRLLEDKWEALGRCSIRENELADVGLPVHPLIPKRVRLSRESLAILTKLRRLVRQELREQSAAIKEFTSPNGLDKTPSVESATDKVKKLDLITKLRRLVLHNWDALERCRISEEILADKGLPGTALITARVQLTLAMVAILVEERRVQRLSAGKTRSTIESHGKAAAGELVRGKILFALCSHTWDALARCSWSHEILEKDFVALLTLTPPMVQLSWTLQAIQDELNQGYLSHLERGEKEVSPRIFLRISHRPWIGF